MKIELNTLTDTIDLGGVPKVDLNDVRKASESYSKTELNILLKPVYKTINANYLASARDFIFLDTTSGPLNITLPSTPTLGDTVIIHDTIGNFSTNACTVLRNGNTIMQLASDYTINTDDSTTEFVFSGTDWRIK